MKTVIYVYNTDLPLCGTRRASRILASLTALADATQIPCSGLDPRSLPLAEVVARSLDCVEPAIRERDIIVVAIPYGGLHALEIFRHVNRRHEHRAYFVDLEDALVVPERAWERVQSMVREISLREGFVLYPGSGI